MPKIGVHGSRCQCLRSRWVMIQLCRRVVIIGRLPSVQVEEDLVERGPAQQHVVDVEAGGVERRGRRRAARRCRPVARPRRSPGGSRGRPVRRAPARRRRGRRRRRSTITRSPPSRSLSSAEVPSAITRPAPMTVIRSASWSASSRYCVVSSTVVPSATTCADRRPHLAAAPRVEAGGRLVEEEHARPADQAGRDVEPAAHAAGVRRDLAAAGVREPVRRRAARRPGRGPRRSRGRAGGRAAPGSPGRAAPRRGRGTARPGRWPPRTAAAVAAYVVPGDADLALVAAGERGEGADRGGLAGAVRARAGRARVPAATSRSKPSRACGVAVPLAQRRGRSGVGMGIGSSNVVRCTEFNGPTASICSVRRTKKLGSDRAQPTPTRRCGCSGGTSRPGRTAGRAAARPRRRSRVDEVVDAAIELADRDGLGALSMRGLAEHARASARCRSTPTSPAATTWSC